MRFLYLLIAACIGAGVFWFYFDVRILDPANAEWLFANGGDGIQHYLGSYAFRSDSWHFPITKTTWINYPEGVSIIYTDSNPLLSILAKLFRPVFPPEYQFFGIWFLLCWILQSVFGFLLVRKLTGDALYALLGGVLFCLLPALIFRVGHANLVAFWLIIWAVYVCVDNELSAGKKLFLFFLIASIASMVHAYLCNMSLIIAILWGIRYLLKLYKNRKEAEGKRALYAFISRGGVYLLFFLVFIWGLGYFYNRPQSSGLLGFGYYSMNMLSPVNPGYPNIFKLPVFAITDGQYEGYNYLGAGVLTLIVLAVVLGSRKKRLWPVSWPAWVVLLAVAGFVLFYKNNSLSYGLKLTGIGIVAIYMYCFALVRQIGDRSVFWLILPATVCFLIALSHIGYMGSYLIYEINLNENAFYSGIFRTMRSSGRFFWVTALILLSVVLVLVYKNVRYKAVAYAILVLAVVLQLADMSYRYKSVNAGDRRYVNPLNEKEKAMIRSAKFLNFLGGVDLHIAGFALLNGIKVNNFYTAHAEGKLTRKKMEQLRENFTGLRSDTMFLFHVNELAVHKTYGLTERFYGNYFVSPAEDYPADDYAMYVTRTVTDTLSSLMKMIKNKPVVVLSVADEASLRMNSFFTHCMDSEFGTAMRQLGYRDSYLALFVNGQLYEELRSETDPVSMADSVLNQALFIKSCGAEKSEPQGVIWRINDTEIIQQARGLNVLALDSVSTSGTPYYLFSNLDTHAFDYPF